MSGIELDYITLDQFMDFLRLESELVMKYELEWLISGFPEGNEIGAEVLGWNKADYDPYGAKLFDWVPSVHGQPQFVVGTDTRAEDEEDDDSDEAASIAYYYRGSQTAPRPLW